MVRFLTLLSAMILSQNLHAENATSSEFNELLTKLKESYQASDSSHITAEATIFNKISEQKDRQRTWMQWISTDGWISNLVAILEGTVSGKRIFDDKKYVITEQETHFKDALRGAVLSITSLEPKYCLDGNPENQKYLCKRFQRTCREHYGQDEKGLYRLRISDSLLSEPLYYESHAQYTKDEIQRLALPQTFGRLFAMFCLEMQKRDLLKGAPQRISEWPTSVPKLEVFSGDFPHAVAGSDGFVAEMLNHCIDRDTTDIVSRGRKLLSERKTSTSNETKNIQKSISDYEKSCRLVSTRLCSNVFFVQGVAALSYITANCELRNVTAEDVEADAEKFVSLGATKGDALMHLALKELIQSCVKLRDHGFFWRHETPIPDPMCRRQKSPLNPSPTTPQEEIPRVKQTKALY